VGKGGEVGEVGEAVKDVVKEVVMGMDEVVEEDEEVKEGKVASRMLLL
jgi:hypothetical protein